MLYDGAGSLLHHDLQLAESCFCLMEAAMTAGCLGAFREDARPLLLAIGCGDGPGGPKHFVGFVEVLGFRQRLGFLRENAKAGSGLRSFALDEVVGPAEEL